MDLEFTTDAKLKYRILLKYLALKMLLLYKCVLKPKEFKIVQCSGAHTASTVLTNLLYGIFSPEEPVNYDDFQRIKNGIVLKTHNLSLFYLEKKLYRYKVYYVNSKREHHTGLPEDFKTIKNVIIFDFDEINITADYTVPDICKHVLYKLKNSFPDSVWPKASDEEILSNMVNRFLGLNKRCEEIKDEPFSYVDDFYHIHGAHRGRKYSLKGQ